MPSRRKQHPARAKRVKPLAIPPIRQPLDRREAKRLYETGLTVQDVARRLGYSYATVHGALREQGLGPRSAASKTGKWARELYARWKVMRSKCHRRRDIAYPSYGGRGIGICAEWEHFPAFREWARTSGFRPELDLTLIRPDRSFSPRNCRWQTRAETVQRSVRERSPKIRALGETKTLVAWAADRRCRVSFLNLKRRLQAGHEMKTALSHPPGALRSVRKRRRSQPLLEVSKRDRLEIDWERVAREWRAEPTSFAELKRRLGVSWFTVDRHLGHLKGIAQRKRFLAPDQEKNLRKLWGKLLEKHTDPSAPLYRWFGGRGLRVCHSWSSFPGFLEWAASSGYRPGLWLTRLDRRKGYSPSNCRWMPPDAAARRPKYNVKPVRPRWLIRAFGEVQGFSAWADDRRCQVSRTSLLRRLRGGWEPEAALTTPPNHPGPPPRVGFTAFGVYKTLIDWSKDRRCRVSLNCLQRRFGRGVPAEEALVTPAFQLESEPSRKTPARSRRSRR